MESEPSGATRQDDESLTSRLDWENAFTLSWKAGFALGLATLILGVIIAVWPTQSLIAVAVLLGIVMLVSGLYHIVQALTGREHDRVWRGITGVLFVLAGLVLLRHLHLSIALIGLFVGFTWIVQGVSSLMQVFSRRSRGETGWTVFFGIISLIAGIVVVSAPIATVGALTLFLGIWFIVMGLFEMIGAVVTRRELHKWQKSESEGVRVPGQRAGAGGQMTAQDIGSQPASRDSRG